MEAQATWIMFPSALQSDASGQHTRGRHRPVPLHRQQMQWKHWSKKLQQREDVAAHAAMQKQQQRQRQKPAHASFV